MGVLRIGDACHTGLPTQFDGGADGRNNGKIITASPFLPTPSRHRRQPAPENRHSTNSIHYHVIYFSPYLQITFGMSTTGGILTAQMSHQKCPLDESSSTKLNVKGDGVNLDSSGARIDSNTEGNLDEDYAKISKLVVALDREMLTMTESIGSIIKSVPVHDQLAATLQAYGQSVRSDKDIGMEEDAKPEAKRMKKNETNKSTRAVEDEYADYAIMGDEAAENDDPLVFI